MASTARAGNAGRILDVSWRVILAGPATLDGVSFAARPDKLLIPIREIANALDLPFGKAKGKLVFGGAPLAPSGPTLPDGTRLVPLASLTKLGVNVTFDRKKGMARLGRKGKAVYVRNGQQRVYIEKSSQTLRALQGTRTVLRTHISTGVEGKATPNGIFEVQGYRSRLHKSKLYDDAPMPFAVQIVGNIFVHGWPKVKGRPASHGCIRLPVPKAEFFYDWTHTGTPVVVRGKWRG